MKKGNLSYFYILCILHLGSVLIGMTITSRIILIEFSKNSFYMTGGIFFIPIVFFIQDIVTEVYGYYNARKMLITTIIIFIIYVAILYLFSLIPCENNAEDCVNLSRVLTTLPRHAFSFVISLAIGGTVNNYILAKLQLMFNSKFLAIRFISSTAIGEAIFQLIAVAISWYGTYSLYELLPIAFLSYLYKIIFEILITPANIFICRFLKSVNNNGLNYVIRPSHQ